MDVSPSDGGTVEVNQNAWSSYPSSYTFETDAVVSLKAVPASGYEFDSWLGEVVDPSSVTTTVNMDCDKTVIANFSQIQIMHTLTIQVSGSGSTAPTVDIYSYGEGTVIDITAIPDSGWQFDSWTGDVADSSAATTTVTMDCDKTVTANFSRETAPTPEPVAKPPLNWPLVGGILGGVVVVGFLIFALAIRRRA